MLPGVHHKRASAFRLLLLPLLPSPAIQVHSPAAAPGSARAASSPAAASCPSRTPPSPWCRPVPLCALFPKSHRPAPPSPGPDARSLPAAEAPRHPCWPLCFRSSVSVFCFWLYCWLFSWLCCLFSCLSSTLAVFRPSLRPSRPALRESAHPQKRSTWQSHTGIARNSTSELRGLVLLHLVSPAHARRGDGHNRIRKALSHLPPLSHLVCSQPTEITHNSLQSPSHLNRIVFS
jgi:hypothetical protein